MITRDSMKLALNAWEFYALVGLVALLAAFRGPIRSWRRALVLLLGLAPVAYTMTHVFLTAPIQSPATWALWWSLWWKEFGPLPGLAGVVVGFVWPRRPWVAGLVLLIPIGVLFAAADIIQHGGTGGAPLVIYAAFFVPFGAILAAPTTGLGTILGGLAGWSYRRRVGEAEFSVPPGRRWWVSDTVWLAIAVVSLMVGLLLAKTL